ncbi:MAG: biotin transporter BioY [Acidobacteriota bacterium]
MNRIAALSRLAIVPRAMDRPMGALFFLLACALGAFVVIPLPFTPVPLTLQTFFVLLGGIWLGSSWAGGVQAAYLGLGGSGMGLFAGGAAGLAVLAGPTAGYLWAFVPASVLAGYGWKRFSGFWPRLLVLAAADLLILTCGASWLGLLLHAGPQQAVLLGLLPFIPGEIIKVICAAGIGMLITKG